MSVTRLSDELDRAIVGLLEHDGRLPSLEIARRLGVSEKTVRTLIGRLVQLHGMRIVANLDGPVTRTGMLFFVHTEAGRRFDVAERMARLPHVDHVYLTTGAFDMVIQASFASDSDALEFLVREVEGAEGVRTVQSSHLIKEVVAGEDGLEPPSGSARTLGAPWQAIQRFVIDAAQAASVPEVLELACESALAALLCDRVLVTLFAEAGTPGSGVQLHRPRLTGGYSAVRNLTNEYVDEVTDRVDHAGVSGVSLRVVETGLHVFVEDALVDPMFEGLYDLVKGAGYRSLLALPLFHGDEVIGALNLYYDKIHRPNEDEIATAQALADQVALAATRGPRVAAGAAWRPE